MRFATAAGGAIGAIAAVFATIAYWIAEAYRQEAIFGGVLVLPDITATLVPVVAGTAAVSAAACAVVQRMNISRRYTILAALSAALASTYGCFSPGMLEFWDNSVAPAALKASGIVVLGLIALLTRSRLLAAGLLFGALGDALLAWSPDTFLYGALAFLIGHLFYIALFLRAGIGLAALKQPPRLLVALALIAAAIGMTSLLVPRDSAMFAPLSIYTGVLTLMAITSITLPAARWLAMIGAVLFFISDGFVAAGMFHPIADPTLAFWRSFAGWMIYWAGQAAICFGALGLHKAQTS
jgi:uncharacterized membrane protein YhhN